MKSILEVWKDYLSSLKSPEYSEIWVTAGVLTDKKRAFYDVSDLDEHSCKLSFTTVIGGDKRVIEMNGNVVYKERYVY